MSKVITPPAGRFGNRLDANGNPRPGYAHPAATADFDKSRVKAGVSQVWADEDGAKYMAVAKLPATDTLPERFAVSVISPSGDVQKEREMTASAFAAFRLESDPSIKRPELRPIPAVGIEGQLINRGTPESAAIGLGIADAEVTANLVKVDAALHSLRDHVRQVTQAVAGGGVDWLGVAAVLTQIADSMRNVYGATREISRHAEALGQRALTPEDVMILTVFAAESTPTGLTIADVAASGSAMFGPGALAAFKERVRALITLGWLEPSPEATDASALRPGPRMFEVVFQPPMAETRGG